MTIDAGFEMLRRARGRGRGRGREEAITQNCWAR